MNATRLASLSAALAAVALVAAGCATNRDDRAMQTPEPMAPVAAAPLVQQPDPIVAEVRAPAPMATAPAPAETVMTTTPPIYEPVAPSARTYDDNLTERAPRADRN